MADGTAIEWADASWNPIRARDKETGKIGWFCTHASEGCRFCYAERFNVRLGTGVAYHAQNRDRIEIFIDEKILVQPLSWRRPRRIFTLSMSDLFGEFVPDEWIDRVFAVMALAPQHIYILLTKRVGRMKQYACEPRRRDLVAAEIRRVGDRLGGARLASSDATRARTKAGDRGIRAGQSSEPLRASQDGILERTRLLSDLGDDSRREDDGGSAPGRMDAFQRPDPHGLNDQPQERKQDRQSAVQSGIGNAIRAASARADDIKCRSCAPEGFAAPEDQADRSGRSENPLTSDRGDASERHRGGIRNRSSRGVADLHAEDVAAHLAWPLPNVWKGVSAEDQTRADERIPALLATPAAKRFLSAEPMLSAVDIAWALSGNPFEIAAGFLARGQFSPGAETLRGLDWVIAGGESGHGARPMHPAWPRSLRDQCAGAGVPFFFKQWGEHFPTGPLADLWVADGVVRQTAQGLYVAGWGAGVDASILRRVGKRAAGRLLDGREWSEFPA